MNNKKLSVLTFALVLACAATSAKGVGTNNEPTIIKAQTQKEQVVLSSNEDTQVQDEQKVKANKELLEKAQAEYDNKDFQSAIVHSTIYINSKPKKYEAYKLRGDAFYEMRQFKLAEKDYQTAVDLKKSDDKFMTNTKYVSAVILGADKNEQLQNTELGNLYGRLMYAQKALNNPKYEEAYENAIKYNSHIYLPQPNKSEINQINCPQKYGKIVNPKGVDEDIYGAINDIEKENYNEALYKLQKVTDKYPKYYQGYYLTGVALSGLEQYDNAIHSFEQALKYNPYDFESLASLGQSYYNKSEISFSDEDSKKSIDYFKQAIKYNNNCNTYYFYIGLNELQSGNIALAIDNFNKAVKLNTNDYNSIYYRSIANYMRGDYGAVIDDSTKLLYKHVSNYNSVLYLRALAYYKKGMYEKSLADLDNIQNEINDIYNADVKNTSEKEKTLDSYVYYLMDKIAKAQGTGDRANLANAYKNPIIAKLAQAQNSAVPYEKVLNSENISINDYKKFEDFYNTSLPKLLRSDAVITLNDIDNQYDYLRTTFDDLGISFKQKGNGYIITTIDNYPYKKYSHKLSNEDLNIVSQDVPEDIRQEVLSVSKVEMKQQTSQMDMLGDEAQPSLAQMLATNSLLGAQQKSAAKKIVAKNDLNEENDVTKIEFKPQSPDAEKTQSSNIASGEPFIYVDKPSKVDKVNTENVEKILEEEKSIQTPEIRISDKTGGVKITANELKNTSDVTISYIDTRKEIEKVLTDDNANNSIQKVNGLFTQYLDKESEIIPENPQQTIAYKQAAAVVEKHADVKPLDYGMQDMPYPMLSDGDEVIELEKENLFKETAQNIEKTENKISDSVSNIYKDIKNTIQEDVTEPFTLEEVPKTVKNENENKEVPVVVIPNITTASKVTAAGGTELLELPLTQVIPAVKSDENDIKTFKPKDVMREDYSLPVKTDNKIAEAENNLKLRLSENTEQEKEIEQVQYLTKEKVQEEKAKIRQNLKEQKEQLKQAQKEAKLRAKEQAAAQKAKAKTEKEQILAETKALRDEQKELLLKEKEQKFNEVKEKELAQEIEKEKQKAQQELEKAQAKAQAQKAKLEAKINEDSEIAKLEKIKEQTEKENTKQQIAEQKALLKAERAQAKAEAKARKEAQKAQAKNQDEKEVNVSEKAKKTFGLKNFFSKFKRK